MQITIIVEIYLDTGFKGFLDGYRYAKETKSAWFETKRRVLEAFLLKKSQA
jgi:hypothetical protein